MNQKLSATIIAALLLGIAPASVQAQGVQNWVTNEINKIQQDSQAGSINPNQAANLTNRDAQIQAQNQQYLNQNGGTLTPQQSQQLGSELRQVNRHLNGDQYRNNPAAYNNGYIAPAPNGYIPPVPGQWQQNLSGTANSIYNQNAAAYQQQQALQNSNNMQRHHHHRQYQSQQYQGQQY